MQGCYVCLQIEGGSQESVSSELGILRVTCPRCGIYDIAHKYVAGVQGALHLTAQEKLTLSHAIRSATDEHGRFGEAVLSYETVKQLIELHPLPDPVDQVDLLVASIASRTAYAEVTPAEKIETWLFRIGLKDKRQLYIMQQEVNSWVSQKGLAPAGDGSVVFGLTLDGWKRARELRRERGSGNQAFVAMWFHPDMRGVYDEGFAPALRATGHDPYRVDLAAHEGKVDDEIIAQIRRSKLVVIDATGNRPNAYFEAGFAMGLAIPVIWTCNESWDACIHAAAPNSAAPQAHEVKKWPDALAFDTRQHPFILWSDAPDLKKKLTDRICARGFDAALTSGQR